MNPIERWKDVKGYEGLYRISNHGNVIAPQKGVLHRGFVLVKRERRMKLVKEKDGYLVVTLAKDKIRRQVRVHRLVATHFRPNDNNYPFINHLDNDRANNVESNLEWCSAKMNTQHMLKQNRGRFKAVGKK